MQMRALECKSIDIEEIATQMATRIQRKDLKGYQDSPEKADPPPGCPKYCKKIINKDEIYARKLEMIRKRCR